MPIDISPRPMQRTRQIQSRFRKTCALRVSDFHQKNPIDIAVSRIVDAFALSTEGMDNVQRKLVAINAIHLLSSVKEGCYAGNQQEEK